MRVCVCVFVADARLSECGVGRGGRGREADEEEGRGSRRRRLPPARVRRAKNKKEQPRSQTHHAQTLRQINQHSQCTLSPSRSSSTVKLGERPTSIEDASTPLCATTRSAVAAAARRPRQTRSPLPPCVPAPTSCPSLVQPHVIRAVATAPPPRRRAPSKKGRKGEALHKPTLEARALGGDAWRGHQRDAKTVARARRPAPAHPNGGTFPSQGHTATDLPQILHSGDFLLQ